MRRPGAREQAQRQARGDEQQRRHALHGGASECRCVCPLRGVRRGRAPQARQETGSCRGARTAAPSAQVASAGPPVRQPADAAPHPQRSAAAHATPASHHAAARAPAPGRLVPVSLQHARARGRGGGGGKARPPARSAACARRNARQRARAQETRAWIFCSRITPLKLQRLQALSVRGRGGDATRCVWVYMHTHPHTRSLCPTRSHSLTHIHTRSHTDDPMMASPQVTQGGPAPRTVLCVCVCVCVCLLVYSHTSLFTGWGLGLCECICIVGGEKVSE